MRVFNKFETEKYQDLCVNAVKTVDVRSIQRRGTHILGKPNKPKKGSTATCKGALSISGAELNY